MNRTQRKTDFLGMNWSTANNRLKKMIIFKLLVDSSKNVCFKCSSLIENIEELSIEHKKPWENIDVALFWDMNNIAFSHVSCNRNHSYPTKKQNSEGFWWCNSCRSFKNSEDFYKDSTKINGHQAYCKHCRKEKDTRKGHHANLAIV